MVPADADDIKREYEILLDEVVKFNPELEDKHRVLAISKSDMLDEELIEEMKKELPEGVPCVFLSSVTGQGVMELKDMLWAAITDESNRIEPSAITHRPLDGHHRVREEDEFIFENEPMEIEEEEEEFFYEGDDWGEHIDYDWVEYEEDEPQK